MPLTVSRRAIAKASLLIAAMAAMPNSAATEEANKDSPPESLFGIEWRVADLAGTEPIADHMPTLTLAENGRAGGNTGCNTYFSTAAIDGNAISFSEVGSTYIACDEEVMVQEQAFLEALGLAAQYRLGSDGLELLDRDGAFLVRFVATA